MKVFMSEEGYLSGTTGTVYNSGGDDDNTDDEVRQCQKKNIYMPLPHIISTFNLLLLFTKMEKR